MDIQDTDESEVVNSLISISCASRLTKPFAFGANKFVAALLIRRQVYNSDGEEMSVAVTKLAH